MELSGFYGGGGGGGGGDTDTSSLSNGEGGGLKAAGGSSPYPAACGRPSLPALKFHNHFPPDNLSSLHDKKDSLLMQVQELQGSVLQGVPQAGLTGAVVSSVGNRLHLQQQQSHLRPADAEERVMLYVRQESEDVYTPLHVTPPTVQGLLNAVRNILKLFSFIPPTHIDISHTQTFAHIENDLRDLCSCKDMIRTIRLYLHRSRRYFREEYSGNYIELVH